MKWLLPLALMTAPAFAEMRPVPRPDGLVEQMSTRGASALPDTPAVAGSVRPVGRQSEASRIAQAIALYRADPRPVIDSAGLVRRSPRPVVRDSWLIDAASRRPRSAQSGGGICGRPSIQGQAIDPVPGAGACGIPQAVRVTAVSGIALSRSARMDCGTAQALDDWVRQGVIPVVGNTGGGAVSLKVAAGYACRTRNNQPGGRLSEHGKGRAIDISGIMLANGSEINVLRDWGRGAEGRILRELHRRACGPFGTVLGPDGDRFHQDHFHFDTARYRSGPFCR